MDLTMKNKNNFSDTAEVKEYQGKGLLNKYEMDLFNEDRNVVEKIIRVKRISNSNKCERWKVLEDTKTIFILDGTKISKKEKEFLRTIDGFNFLIGQFKTGIKSLNKLRIELKKYIKERNII